MNAAAIPITEKHPSPAFAFKKMRGRSMVVIAVAILLILPALLLSGAARIAAIGGILFVVGMLFDVYRFEVDPVRQQVTIRTLWLGWQERSAVTYGFSDVLRLEKTSWADGESAFRWRFGDGATYEFLAPVDERLYELFREKEGAGVRKREGNADYACGPDWRLVERADEIVMEPNEVRGAIAARSFCGVIVAVVVFLAALGTVSAFAAIVAAAVCGLLAALVTLYVVSETKKGPWLHFDRVRQRLILPRWDLDFGADALVAWETKCVHWDVGDETIPVTELRLVVRATGGEQRYVLLACRDRSAAYWWRAARSRFVRALAQELAALTRLSVREANARAGEQTHAAG
ncbi:MAG TPA: hypothetical protein VG826_23890 [Pirellulales bacterium]|nr:hypothetical protein [Pirellulales bacterium]